jgi:catechol 2,3-dioxygenase-like lactoylglutathione lyase family enzyme
LTTTEDRSSVDMKLEVIVIGVTDVDRAKDFYARLGWRLDADVAGEVGETFHCAPAATTFGSASDLADAIHRASAAHGEHEQRIGHADPDWPDWYARYMVAEQAGTELPS